MAEKNSSSNIDAAPVVWPQKDDPEYRTYIYDGVVAHPPAHKNSMIITDDHLAQLKDLLVEVKKYHAPGKAVTRDDMSQFKEQVFRNWNSDIYYWVPSNHGLKAGQDNTSVLVGYLFQDAQHTTTSKRNSLNPNNKRSAAEMDPGQDHETRVDRMPMFFSRWKRAAPASPT